MLERTWWMGRPLHRIPPQHPWSSTDTCGCVKCLRRIFLFISSVSSIERELKRSLYCAGCCWNVVTSHLITDGWQCNPHSALVFFLFCQTYTSGILCSWRRGLTFRAFVFSQHFPDARRRNERFNCGKIKTCNTAIQQKVAQQVVSEEMMIFFLFSLKWVYANKNYEMIYNEHWRYIVFPSYSLIVI